MNVVNVGFDESGSNPCRSRVTMQVTKAAPRTRGDGPSMPTLTAAALDCSPHPRGWSLRLSCAPPLVLLLPAPAGMVPRGGAEGHHGRAAPRTRGDGPPHAGRSHQAPRCSPHPRGWSLGFPLVNGGAVLLPAPAGMVPLSWSDRLRTAAAPRTRGDGPGKLRLCGSGMACSPHPRGWSQGPHRRQSLTGLLPAPAGMVPSNQVAPHLTCAAPRTRGDGPNSLCANQVPGLCSPHPRGWSRPVFPRGWSEALLPAPAGMVPPVAANPS